MTGLLKFLAFALILAASGPADPGLQGPIVLAGGGSEGDIGDTSAWSYPLYGRLLQRGDVTGDGIVSVAVLAASDQTEWLPLYFEWIGTTLGLRVDARNFFVRNRKEADSPDVADGIGRADAIFIKGGDQGVYYDIWNGTLLETAIRAASLRGAAIGGTSAGAMALSECCLSGSRDLISSDVMSDAFTPYLDDASDPGTSGIHTDFLSLLRDIAVDTHFTQRGRLGRLAGILAKATEDAVRPKTALLGIGIDEQTGIAVADRVAEIFGRGAVTFLRASDATRLDRRPGCPLVYTDLLLDRLLQGERFDLNARRARPAIESPPRSPAGLGAGGVSGPGWEARMILIDGGRTVNSDLFEYTVSRQLMIPGLIRTTSPQFVPGTVGFTDAGSSSNRAPAQQAFLAALSERPDLLAVLGFQGGGLLYLPSPSRRFLFSGSSAWIIADVNPSSSLDGAGWTGSAARGSTRLHILASLGPGLSVFDLDRRTIEEFHRPAGR